MSACTPIVSIVIPVYNEVGSLRELHGRIREELDRLGTDGEILFIDDGSTDGSRECLAALAGDDPACRVIVLRRNCGKAAALRAGFDAARGAFLITMDADLQDDPAEIPRFLQALQSADLVSGWKVVRHDPVGKTLPSRLFNAVVRDVTGSKLHDMNCGFKGYRRQVVEELALYGELHRFIPVLASARGFRVAELAVTHHPRRHGVSKYGWERFLRGFFDLITVVYLTKYRTRPMHFFGNIGVVLFFVGFAIAIALSVFADFYDQFAWRSFFWMTAFTTVTLGIAAFAFGLLAEGQLAASRAYLPPPPTAERLNFEEAVTADKGDHAD